jgi:hypothetical protein
MLTVTADIKFKMEGLNDSWAGFLDNSVDDELECTALSSELDLLPSDVSFASPKNASTPKGKTIRNKVGSNVPTSARNKSKRQLKLPLAMLVACTHHNCAKSFKTSAGLRRHERIHRLSGKQRLN